MTLRLERGYTEVKRVVVHTETGRKSRGVDEEEKGVTQFIFWDKYYLTLM